MGVPPVKLWGTAVVTKTCCPGVAPSPDSIFVMFKGSVAKAPTISNSGLCGAKPFGDEGYFCVISLFADALLYAFDNLL